MGQTPFIQISGESMNMLQQGHALMNKFKIEYGRIPTEEELTKYDIKLMPVSDLFHKIKEMKKIAARIQGNCFEKEWLKMANDELLLRKVNVRLAYKCLIKRGK